ncbi:MAG: hypothetical protein KBG46_14520, partial [Paracoccus sp.]|nr:hypothetical protein [Paracoccus sp. (in: a-proteobacteria)]
QKPGCRSNPHFADILRIAGLVTGETRVGAKMRLGGVCALRRAGRSRLPAGLHRGGGLKPARIAAPGHRIGDH